MVVIFVFESILYNIQQNVKDTKISHSNVVTVTDLREDQIFRLVQYMYSLNSISVSVYFNSACTCSLLQWRRMR